MRQRLMPLAAFGILVDLLAWPACAALASGVYQTVPGATVEERGDRVPNRSRVVPFFATLAFDLSATEPSLTAVITNAVLEGGEPFSLIVRSSTGAGVDFEYRAPAFRTAFVCRAIETPIRALHQPGLRSGAIREVKREKS